jgi:hypothetical protein
MRAKHVAQRLRVERVGGVHRQQLQPRRAQVDAVDGPVVEPRHPECTAVAHTPAEHPPCVEGVAAVLPDDLGHLEEVVGLLLADAVR